jgi:hypothetical protein
MSPTARRPVQSANAASEFDWRWGFEPEAWMSLRSRKAMGYKPAAAVVSTEPSAPARRLFPRLAAAALALFGG